MASGPEVTTKLSVETGTFLSSIRTALSTAQRDVAAFVRSAGRIAITATADTSAASGPLGKLRDDADKTAASAKKNLTDIRASVDTGNARAELDKFGNKVHEVADNANRELDGVGKKGGGGAESLAKGGLLAGVGLGLVALGKGAIDANAEMETFNVQIATLIKGSADFKEKYKGVTDPLKLQALAAEAAKDRMAELNKFGAETPFELPEIAKAEKVLLGFGLTGQRAMKQTGKSATELRTVIGDVAAGTGAKFDEIALTLGKFSSGAAGESISRLQELGVVTKEELKKAGIEFDKAGGLTSPIDKALTASVKIMQDKFGGGMKQLSGTFNGQLSTLADNAKQTLAALGAPLFQAAKVGLDKFLGVFSAEPFQKAVGQLGDVLAKVAGPLAETFTTLLVPLLGLIGPLAGLVSSVLLPIGQALGGIAAILASALTAVIGPVGNALGAIGSLLSSILVPILGALTKLLAPLIKIVAAVAAILVTWLSVLIPIIEIALQPMIIWITAIIDVLTELITPIAEVIAQFSQLFQQLVAELQPILREILPLITDMAKIFAGVLVEGIKLAVSVARSLVTQLVDLILKLTGSSTGSEAFAKILGVVKSVVSGVVGIIKNLRAELAGIAGVFQFAIAAIKQFIDGVLDFDVDKVSGSFANFFDGAKKAYEKGKADFLRTTSGPIGPPTPKPAEPVDDPLKPPPGGDKAPPDANKAKEAEREAERVRDLLEKIQARIDATRGETARRELDERVAELAALRASNAVKLAEIEKQLKEETNAQVREKLRTLVDVTRLANEAAERDKTVDLVEKGLKKLTTTISDQYKKLADEIRTQEDAISDATVGGIAARGELRRRSLAAALDNEVRLVVAASPAIRSAFEALDREFLNGALSQEEYDRRVEQLLASATPAIAAVQQKIAAAGADLLAGAIRPDEYESRIRAILDAARQSLADQPAVVAALTKGTIEQQKQLLDERSRLRALAAKQEEDRIAAITDADERAAAEQSLTARRAYNDKLDQLDQIASRNKELRSAGEIDEAELNKRLVDIDRARVDAQIELEKKLYAARLDYLAKTNAAVSISLTFQKSIADAFRTSETAAEREDRNKKRKSLDDQLADLKGKLSDQSISLREYNREFKRLTKEREEVAGANITTIAGFLKVAQTAITKTLAAIGADYAKRLDASVGKLIDGTGTFGDVLANGAVAFGSIVTEAAISSEGTAKDAAKKTLSILLDVLQSQAAAIVALIIGQEFATKGFLGIATAAVLTGVFLAAVAVGKAALESATFRRHGGPMEGGLIRGGRQVYIVNEEGEEFAVNADATARNRRWLEFINNGGSIDQLLVARALREPAGVGLALDPAGRIVPRDGVDGGAEVFHRMAKRLESVESELALSRVYLKKIDISSAATAKKRPVVIHSKTKVL